MRLAVLSLWLCSVAACAQIAGIDDGASRSSVTVQRVSIGATIVTSPEDLTGLDATYLVPDDRAPSSIRRVTARASNDTWYAPVSQHAAVELSLPDTPLTQLDIPVSALLFPHHVYEHPAPTPVEPGAMLALGIAVPRAVSGELLSLVTVGAWNSCEPPACNLPVTTNADGSRTIQAALPVSAMTSMTGRPLEGITRDDVMVVLAHHADPKTGIELVGAMEVSPFDQDPVTTPITGTLNTVARDELLDVKIGDVVTFDTFFGLRPPTKQALTFEWQLTASPGYRAGDSALTVLLAAQTVPLTFIIDMFSVRLVYAFGNPFVARWPTALNWVTKATRVYPGFGAPITLRAARSQLIAPTPGLVLAAPPPPTQIAVDGVELAVDGTRLAKPTTVVHVSIETTATGEHLRFGVALLDFVDPDHPTVTYNATSLTPELSLPPELFEANHIYAIRGIIIDAVHPDLAGGDLTAAPPIAFSFLDGGAFQVVP